MALRAESAESRKSVLAGIPKLVRDYGALSLGAIVAKLLGFAAFAYLARVLDATAYGQLEIVVGLAAFFALVVDGGLGAIGVRRLIRQPESYVVLAAQIPMLRLLIALVAAPTMIGAGLLLFPSGPPIGLLVLYAGSLFILAVHQEWLLQGRELMADAARAQALRMLVFLGAVILFVPTPDKHMRVGWAEIAAVSAASLYVLLVQHRKVTPVRRASPRGNVGLLRESLPVALSQAVWSANQFVPLFLMGALVGGAATGFFAAAHRLVFALATFSFLYHFNLYPAMARAAATDTGALGQLQQQSFRVSAWVSAAGVLAVTIAAAPLLALLFGPAFAETKQALWVLIWLIPLMLLSGHARWALIVAGKQTYVLYAQLCGLLSSMLIGVPFVRLWGGEGAAAAAVAGAVAVWSVSHHLARKAKVPVPQARLAALPLGLAAVLSAGGIVLGLDPWITAALALFLFAGIAPVLDRTLARDIRKLMQAKSSMSSNKPA